MAKELALITARNNRNKKKKEQLDLQAPVKAITNTVKKVEPKQNIAKKTTTQKTTTQKTTQRPQTNLLSNNNTRTMPTFESKDNRTVKTTNTNKNKNKASSIKTVDIYTKGGRFYYEDNGKEHEVDRDSLMNAWNNNRSGVVGRIDKKGKFQETDSRGVSTQELANKNYKEKLDILNKAQKSLSKKSGEEYRKRGIDLSTQNNLRLNPQNQMLNFSDRNEQTKSAQQRLTERATKQQPLIEEANKQLKQEIQDVNKAANDYVLAKYQKNVADVNNKDIGVYDKTLGAFVTGVQDIGSNFVGDNKYTDENGNTIYLPNRAELLWQKTRDSYGDNIVGKLARFGGDVAHEGGKIATTALLNAPTGGLAGSALYFSDIAGDIYKQNINEGYGEDKAWTDALLKTGQSYIKQKIIGGLGGKLTGSGPSWLEKSLTNTWSKAVSNPVVSKTLASMSSEAIDEFTDEWIESAIDSAVLGKDFDPMQVFKESLYSGAIGGATGAFGGMGDRVTTSLDENRLALQELNTIADQRIQQLQQEVQQDPSKAQEATQEIQDIQNYVQAQTNIIQNQAKTQAQESETEQPNAITQETQNVAQNEQNEGTQESTFNNEEKPKNVGVHYGDLGKARDTYYWNINSSNRSTGHYGTGTYFVSNEESDRMQNSSFTRSDRPRKEVDFDDYNLYKPLIESEAKRLHDGLKAVNYNKYDDFDYRVMVDDLKRNGITQEQIDNAKNAVEEARQKYEKEGYNDKYDAEVDSLSTVFMKSLGFDGIDVRGLEGYDNTSYGSVIYDLKNNKDRTNQNENIPATKSESVINEGKKTSGVFSTVAPYYSKQVNDRNYNKVRSDVDSQFTNKALNIASNLGVNVENIQNNVGGYSFDDGKGRVDELSYTYKLKDGTTKENARMFGCLLGDLGHETQESVVVGNYTNSNNENANLEYTLKLKDGNGIIKALKEAGITDYTFNKQTNELQLLLFKDDNGNFNEQEILDQFQKLNQVLGGKISESTKNYVESELIESEDRQNLYGEWLESNKGTKNRELYSQIEEAYEKVKKFNDKKPKEEQSSFSNENIQSEKENVITIKNDNLKGVPKDQIKGEDTGVSINGKQVQLEVPVDSKPNKLGQYVPKDGFTKKELKSGKLGDSQFYKNVTERADFIQDKVRQDVKEDNYVKHYRKITNDESMQEAFDDLNTRGTEAIADFFNNDKELTSKDTAMGWLLIEQSQANGDYEFTNQVLRKMRSNATKTAQTLQMYNYYARLTPEGMYKWCGDQLARAEEIFEKNKTKKWIDANKKRWQLTPDETDFIKKQMDRVQELNNMNDSDTTTIEMKKGKTKEVTVERAKQVEIAKVQAMIENKIPPAKGQALNAWMRISMLGNLKTIGTRNPLGNIALRPINDVGDIFASAADFAISKVTGVRTKGTFNAKAQAKGFKKGASESVQDVSLGINTRDAKGNRFEIGEGKSFNEKHTGAAKVLNPFSKAGNKLDTGVSFLLDLGDRPFYEATYQQSLENQMKLNGITNPENVTDSMKKIAEQEALERTYQDDNNYTAAVVDIRKAMNKFNVKGYGLGDVLIPFAKTPANLTKAIVDYSPAGFVNAITKGKNLKNSIQNGQFTPEMQHAFVNQLGKATAGTLLYAAGAALAQSGLITGGSDEDKDVADFMRNTLGIQPYSIKIGNKSFTYDWAQPVASGLAIPADIKKGIEDAKEGEVDLEYIVHKAFSTGGTVLLEQSFLQGIKDVLGGYGDPLDNLMSEIEGLPARAIPTLFQQITTYLDGTKRMSYGNKGIGNVLSQAKAKTIFGKDLPVYRNSMGKEIKMYGGKNNFFNVFLNPANYSEGNVTESAEEIYAIYEATNNKDILPKLVSSSLKNEDGSKLTNQQKSDFLKVSGDIIDDNVKELKNNNYYKNMSDEDKAETIKAIVDYAYNIAREEITGHKLSSSYKKAKNATTDGGYAIADYYAKQKHQSKNNKKTTSDRNRYKELADKGIDGATFDDFKAFVKTAKGESRTGGLTKKQKIINYINQLPLSKKEKEALYNDYLENQGYFSYYN